MSLLKLYVQFKVNDVFTNILLGQLSIAFIKCSKYSMCHPTTPKKGSRATSQGHVNSKCWSQVRPWDLPGKSTGVGTFHHRDWNAKVGSQEIPRVTDKFGLGVQNKAGHRLTEFCQENTLVQGNILSQQHKRWLYRWLGITKWSIPKSDWLYSLQPKMEKHYIVSKNKTWS